MSLQKNYMQLWITLSKLPEVSDDFHNQSQDLQEISALGGTLSTRPRNLHSAITLPFFHSHPIPTSLSKQSLGSKAHGIYINLI